MGCLFVVNVPPWIYLGIAWFAFSIGNSELRKGQASATREKISAPPPIPPYRQQQITKSSSAATAKVVLPERPEMDNLPKDLKCPSCGATIKPTSNKCDYCGSSLTPLIELPEPNKLANIIVGGPVRVTTPQGTLDYRVRGRLLFTELWQATRGSNVPWTPTGNYYAGFALDPKAYLLNWQERFYLLTESRPLTDMDINTNFMPYAKQFAQSNQTALVKFPYSGASWQVVDIGRYAIEYEDGEGNHLHKGAIGRFIHAASGTMALIVDDFQSGGRGGQDMLWRGFIIKESDIKF